MDDEQDVDDEQEVVGIPKGIVAGHPVERLGELHQAAPELAGGKCEGHCHEHHHDDPGHPLHPSHQLHVARLLLPEVPLHQSVLVGSGGHEAGEVAGQMVPSMEENSDHNARSYCLKDTKSL